MVEAPPARAGVYPAAELRDVAPTILRLLGLPAPASMKGRPLDELFRGAARVSSGGEVEPRRELVAAGITDADQRCVEARLRDLGYLD